MEELNNLQTLGLTMPTPAYLAAMIIFSVIGFAAYRYGKKAELPITRWLGVALMLFPYAVSETWLLYVLGLALCAALYFWRD